jgi:conjugal transfer pilus assembly protein TraF
MKLPINRNVFLTKLMSLGCVWMTLLAPAHSANFYNKHAERWFWYQDPPVSEDDFEEKKHETKETTAPKAPLTLAQKAHRQMETFKKQLEDLKVIALVSPTPSNVEAYMRIQKEMVDRSEDFSKTWQQVVLNTAELNPKVENPTAQYARHIKNDQLTEQKSKTIHGLAQTYGLIYFFKGNCPYCTGFAPIVKMFADKYNWQVMAVSLDGSPSEVFEDSRPDNGIGEALNIKSVPALIAYNAETNDVIPISYAMTSLDQLENNIMALVGEKS